MRLQQDFSASFPSPQWKLSHRLFFGRAIRHPFASSAVTRLSGVFVLLRRRSASSAHGDHNSNHTKRPSQWRFFCMVLRGGPAAEDRIGHSFTARGVGRRFFASRPRRAASAAFAAALALSIRDSFFCRGGGRPWRSWLRGGRARRSCAGSSRGRRLVRPFSSCRPRACALLLLVVVVSQNLLSSPGWGRGDGLVWLYIGGDFQSLFLPGFATQKRATRMIRCCICGDASKGKVGVSLPPSLPQTEN